MKVNYTCISDTMFSYHTKFKHLEILKNLTSYLKYSTRFDFFLGKRILDSIAETFSPKSPKDRSPVKSPLKEDNSSSSCQRKPSGDNVSVENSVGKSDRSRRKHRLYSEDTYISDPIETTGEFVV